MTGEEGEKDPSKLIYDLPECFMMTWEKLMGMISTTAYDIWSEVATETLNYPISTYGGDTLNPNQTTQHPQMGGDTSNPKRTIKHPQMGGDTSNPKEKSKHLQMGGDTSNPKTLIPMIQPKLPTSQGEEGRHFKPPHLETNNPVEALNRST